MLRPKFILATQAHGLVEGQTCNTATEEKYLEVAAKTKRERKQERAKAKAEREAQKARARALWNIGSDDSEYEPPERLRGSGKEPGSEDKLSLARKALAKQRQKTE